MLLLQGASQSLIVCRAAQSSGLVLSQQARQHKPAQEPELHLKQQGLTYRCCSTRGGRGDQRQDATTSDSCYAILRKSVRAGALCLLTVQVLK